MGYAAEGPHIEVCGFVCGEVVERTMDDMLDEWYSFIRFPHARVKPCAGQFIEDNAPKEGLVVQSRFNSLRPCVRCVSERQKELAPNSEGKRSPSTWWVTDSDCSGPPEQSLLTTYVPRSRFLQRVQSSAREPCTERRVQPKCNGNADV